MPTNILMPALSPTMEEGTLTRWLVKEGDAIRAGDVIAEIETDKAVMEVEAVDDGVLGRLVVSEGAEGVKVNAPIAVLLEEGEEPDLLAVKDFGAGVRREAAPAPVAPENTGTITQRETPPRPMNGAGGRIFASPLARRLAARNGVDLEAITGSGPHGRIVRADVEAAGQAQAKAASMASAPTLPASPGAETVKALYADRAFEEVALDGMRKIVAARLTEAKQTIPHFYLRRDIALDALLAGRATLNARLADRGVKLSVNDFIIKACALALQQIPEANSVWAGDRILRLAPSDVAVAVAVEGGLYTPVIRDAEQKTLSAISAEMKDLAARARDRKLAPPEYQGGTFAISNLGMYGISNFDAVINPPHGSILAVGAGMEKPVAREGQMAVATMMSVTLSVDHRVIDGALGARFLAEIKGYLEEPMTMLA